MADSNKPLVVEEYEGILRQIRDVISARVVLDENNTVEEIHVLAGTGRSPKQIVRDIESALLAHFNLPVDHKKVSVAQLDWEAGVARRDTSVRLVAISAQSAGLLHSYSVTLDMEGEQYTGEAQGAASSRNQWRLVAEATLRAVETYFKNEVAFTVEEVRQVHLSGSLVAVVTVGMVTARGEETLTGASFIRGDGSGVAKAVLKAVESRLPISAVPG